MYYQFLLSPGLSHRDQQLWKVQGARQHWPPHRTGMKQKGHSDYLLCPSVQGEGPSRSTIMLCIISYFSFPGKRAGKLYHNCHLTFPWSMHCPPKAIWVLLGFTCNKEPHMLPVLSYNTEYPFGQEQAPKSPASQDKCPIQHSFAGQTATNTCTAEGRAAAKDWIQRQHL